MIRLFVRADDLAHFLTSLGPASFIGFIIVQAFQVVVSPIPGEITGFIGGYLYGTVLGILLSTIGLTLGSWIAFSLSKKFGRPFVEKWVKRETLARYDYLLHHKGAFLILLLFLIPGFPKDYLCYILGLGSIGTRQFLFISVTGRLLGTTLLTIGGDSLRHAQYGRFWVLATVGIVVLLLSMMYRDRIEKLLGRSRTSRCTSSMRERT